MAFIKIVLFISVKSFKNRYLIKCSNTFVIDCISTFNISLNKTGDITIFINCEYIHRFICNNTITYIYNFCEYYDNIFCKKLFNVCEKAIIK